MGGGPFNLGEDHVLVVCPWPKQDDVFNRISARYPGLKITYLHLSFGDHLAKCSQIPEDIISNISILVIIGGSLCSQFTLPTPRTSPRLHWVHCLTSGFDYIPSDHPIITDSSITLTTSSGIHGPQIAEWVLMTLLAQSHCMKKLNHWQEQRTWGNSMEVRTTDSVGQRLGVLGYGSIGRQVARVCKAMGMDIVAFTASPRPTLESRRDRGFNIPGTGDIEGSLPSAWYDGLDKPSLHKFLAADIDVLLVCVPLTKETTHLLGKEEFEILGRKKAFISNVARGKVLDQDALIEALKSGTLRGAALDVTDPEPLPSDSELWGMENVTVTPHVSGLATSYVTRAFQVFEENLKRLKDGEAMFNVVDTKRGY